MPRPTRRPRFSGAASQSLPRPILWLIGLAAIAALAITFVVGFNAPNTIPGRSYYTVKAEFAYADNLTAHYQVRIGGRYVGQVLNPHVENGKAVVELQLQPDVAPLKSDTTIRVRPRSPIGVRFLELSPGRNGKPLADGEMIPAAQTSAAAQLDTTLDTLDTKRRREAQTLLSELGAGMIDRGDALNGVIEKAPDALRGADRLTAAVNARGGAPQRLIAGTEGAAAAADPVRRTIREGLRSGSHALRPFADGEEDIRASLEEAPTALSQARTGLSRTDPLLAEVRALSREILPALEPAPRGLREATALLRRSPAGLRSLHTTLDTAKDAAPPTLKLLKTADPVLPIAEATLQASLPLVDRLGVRECDIALFTRTWSSFLGKGVPGGRKDIGPIGNLRLNLLIDEETVGGTVPKSANVADNPYPAPCTVTNDAGTRR